MTFLGTTWWSLTLDPPAPEPALLHLQYAGQANVLLTVIFQPLTTRSHIYVV
jgi:hypothetical protein